MPEQFSGSLNSVKLPDNKAYKIISYDSDLKEDKGKLTVNSVQKNITTKTLTISGPGGSETFNIVVTNS